MAAKFYATGDAGVRKLFSRGIARETEKQTYFGAHLGESRDDMLRILPESSKGSGDNITYQLRTIPTADGVTSNETLRGNEEAMTTYTDSIAINELSYATAMENVISPQRVPFDMGREMAAMCQEFMTRRLEQVMFYHLGGYTPANSLGTVYTGNNTILAPSSTRHIWTEAGTSADENLDNSGDLFASVKFIDYMVEKAMTGDVPLRPCGGPNGNYKLFLHPYQFTDLKTAKSSTDVTWYDYAIAEIQGGKTDENKLNKRSRPVGTYHNVDIYVSDYVPQGVNSSTGAAITTVRRAILCGAQAGTLAFGQGYSFENFKVVDMKDDYEREYGMSCQLVYGFKKTRFNSVDYGAIVCSSYAVAH